MRYFKRATLLLIVLSSLVLLLSGCEDPPVINLENARQALRLAETAGALRYAEIIYRDAEQLVNTGWMEMAKQNGRLAPFRDYENADSILSMALRRANEARQKAIDSIETARSSSVADLTELNGELKEWNEALNGSLVNFNVRDDWQRARLNLDMAEKLMANGEFDEAKISMIKARNLLNHVGAALESHQED